jgi:hypothetical protein
MLSGPRWVVYGLVFACLAAAPLGAQTPAPPAPPRSSVSLALIPRVSRPPRLDDFLQNRPREAELAINEFRQYIPGDGNPASEPTTAYLSYDQHNLYVAFVCHDEQGRVLGHLSRREDVDQDDGVGIFLDTFRDFRRSYFFYSNPLGIQQDAIYTEGQGFDYSFDTVWKTDGRITADGYIVLLSIPFKSLRFSNAPQQTWRVALYRVILRKSEYDYWPYITQRVQSLEQQFAPVGGLDHVSPGRNIQFIPYGLLAGDHFLNQPSPPFTNFAPGFQNAFEHRAGLDAKFVAKDALTFDVTLNPDFSQVETDDPQVTINQRFAVFFPEKRPFFIENAGFFETPVNLFFSRQIADPQFGARMTGKIGKWTLGALAIDDRQPGLGYSAGFYHARAANGVVRITREFGSQSFIGAFFSSRDFADTSNRVASLDARIKLSVNWVADFQVARSWTRQDANLPQRCQNFLPGPPAFGSPRPAASQQGNSLRADIRYAGRHFNFFSYYQDFGPGFCTELGFVNRVDIRQNYSSASYLWRPQGHRVIDFGPAISEVVNWDYNHVLQDWQVNPTFQVDLTHQTTLVLLRGEAMERFSGVPFRKNSTAVIVAAQPAKWLALSARYMQGTGINFFPAAGLAPFLGNTKRVNLSFTLRPTSRFRFDQTYIYSRLGTRDGSTPSGFAPGHGIFNNHLLRSKFNYQFTKEFSLRLILDYDATIANTGLIDLQSDLGSYDGGPVVPTKKATADVLFTYLLHPGTAIYVGYNNGVSNLGLDRSVVPPQVFLRQNPGTSDHLVFVKLSYLFRY